MSLYQIDLHGSGQTHPVMKDPYTDSSQPISNTTLHKNNMFHKPRNLQTAKPENRSSLRIEWSHV